MSEARMIDCTSNTVAYRASILHFLADPDVAGDNAWDYFDDGLLVVESGVIKVVGAADILLQKLTPEVHIVDHRGSLILPGFIDTHTHYPQIGVIASYGEQLLDWLEHYVFPAEHAFSDKSYARQRADVFLNELLRCGTTTAMVFGTVHAESVDAFFEASTARNMRMICGKVLMDRNAPQGLCDTPEQGYQESRELIGRWHGKERQLYAVTPRFAITSSATQLEQAGQLLDEYPGVYLQTHLAENLAETAMVKSLFPARKNYLDVYDYYGLVRKESVFAHGIHLANDELHRLHEAGASIAFCPTSNLFLGSGLLDIGRLEQHNVSYSVATDVGAGTSFSMLTTLGEAYKVAQLTGNKLSPLKSFYQVTLGNAKTLQLDHQVGSFEIGREADFIVLDVAATPLMARRAEQCKTLSEKLFLLMTLGDDRAVKATYVAGACLYQRE